MDYSKMHYPKLFIKDPMPQPIPPPVEDTPPSTDIRATLYNFGKVIRVKDEYLVPRTGKYTLQIVNTSENYIRYGLDTSLGNTIFEHLVGNDYRTHYIRLQEGDVLRINQLSVEKEEQIPPEQTPVWYEEDLVPNPGVKEKLKIWKRLEKIVNYDYV